jgi:hypothetical protein
MDDAGRAYGLVGCVLQGLKDSFHASAGRPLFEGAFRLNIADKESFALSDHLPQLAVFGGK